MHSSKERVPDYTDCPVAIWEMWEQQVRHVQQALSAFMI